MITLCKESKFKKLNKNLVVGVAISSTEIENTSYYVDLLPPPSALIAYNNGDIGKKGLNKKYAKFLEKSELAEYALYVVMLGVKNQRNICFVCTDDEWDIGYLNTLADHIETKYGIEVHKLSEYKARVSEELDSLEKKERKLVNMTDSEEIDELKEKTQKFRAKLIKNIRKAIADEYLENEEYISYLDRKYAIDKVMSAAHLNNVFKYGKNGNITEINEDAVGKSSTYIEAIFASADAYKPYKKIIKSVFEAHSLKFKPKTLKKLTKSELINLVAEISTIISSNRVDGKVSKSESND